MTELKYDAGNENKFGPGAQENNLWQNLASDIYRPPQTKSRPETVGQPINEAVTAHELEVFKGERSITSVAEILRLKQEINKHALEPQQSLVKVMKEHRVLGYGDAHIEPSPHLNLLKDSLPALKAAGATHLAIEMPVNWQSQLEDISARGYVTPEEKALMAFQFKSGASMADVVQSALDAGLKVKAVDRDLTLGDEDITRDKAMARGVETILEDSQAKVVLWVGSNHLRAGTRNEGQATALQNLKNDGVSISSFYQVLAADDTPAHLLSGAAQKTVGLATGDVTLLDRVGAVADKKLADWENVLIYPRGAGVEPLIQELKAGSQPVELVFHQALKDNRVLAVGQLDRLPSLEPEADPLQAQLTLLVPQLKKEGLSHLVLSIPADSQKGLDDFMATGKFEPYAFPLDFRGPDFQNLLQACRQSGIKVSASAFDRTAKREGELAATKNVVEEILKDNPQNKVLLLARTSRIVASPEPNTDGSLREGDSLQARLKTDGERVATFSSYLKTPGLTSGNLVVEGLSQPLAVPREKAKGLTSLKLDLNSPVKEVDTLLVYPARAAKDAQIISR